MNNIDSFIRQLNKDITQKLGSTTTKYLGDTVYQLVYIDKKMDCYMQYKPIDLYNKFNSDEKKAFEELSKKWLFLLWRTGKVKLTYSR